ncbi:5153_t:CDS:2 [Racocetra persica]|uniref:5153_t:CDS:1 n=1 Tax=Racocetra persica TaxID=160502 RepID=A0ACA9KTR2_9GLOM|nr:5153_t:CDS:2 [Racocetra persica]
MIMKLSKENNQDHNCKDQPDLNIILTALNQIQLDYQMLHQENVELKNTLNQLQGQEGANIQYKNPKTQVGLLGSLLSGPALAWFSSLLEKQLELLGDFEILVKKFEKTFGFRAASSYASESWQIADNLNWGEAALIDQFRNRLQNDIKDLLLTVEDLTSLNDAISKAIRCNN